MEILYRILIILACLIVGYLFGSIPNGVLIGKLFFKKDPRLEGSHNSGGTNTGRVLGGKAGAATIILDICKVIIPTLIGIYLFQFNTVCRDFMLGSNLENNVFGIGNTLNQLCYYIIPLGGMLGHAYSIFLKFKGGKIVSTYGGTALCYSYLSIPLLLPFFLITLKKTKYVSLSSIVGSLATMIFSWLTYLVYALTFNNGDFSKYLMWFNFGPQCSIYYPIVVTLSWVLLMYKHKDNIIRLKNKTESKIHWMK